MSVISTDANGNLTYTGGKEWGRRHFNNSNNAYNTYKQIADTLKATDTTDSISLYWDGTNKRWGGNNEPVNFSTIDNYREEDREIFERKNESAENPGVFYLVAREVAPRQFHGEPDGDYYTYSTEIGYTKRRPTFSNSNKGIWMEVDTLSGPHAVGRGNHNMPADWKNLVETYLMEEEEDETYMVPREGSEWISNYDGQYRRKASYYGDIRNLAQSGRSPYGGYDATYRTQRYGSILNLDTGERSYLWARHPAHWSRTEQYITNAENQHQQNEVRDSVMGQQYMKGIEEQIDAGFNVEKNKIAEDISTKNAQVNKVNTAKNNLYNKVKDIANRTTGADYTTQRDRLTKDELITTGISNSNADKILGKVKDVYKDFYRTEKLQKWDSNLAHPIPGPTGSQFKGGYYLQQSQAAKDTWDDAVAVDDIDITERYNNDPNIFALQHWSNQGRHLGLRAYEPAQATAAIGYEEITTDNDVQAARDIQLGISTNEDGTYNNVAYRNKILNIPYIAAEYTKASSNEGDDYWKNLGDQWNLNEKDKDQFIVLFRLSERDEDKSISFLHNINNPQYGGISELEDAVTEAAGDKARVDIQNFGDLTKNVLKETIAEIKEAKEKESFLATIKNFAGYGEIMDINQSLSNSLLGDLGKGGYLSWMGGEDTKDALERSMENITGVRNNVTHNWQKWYDEELKTKYQAGGTFYKGEDDPATEEDERESYEIDAEFGRAFIDEYLTKRFDQSKSMNEFVEYLDVRDSEQNPFQTMDMLSALNLDAKLEADEWQRLRKEEIDNGQAKKNFDAKFYLNPSSGEENIGKTAHYTRQTERLRKDLQEAKNTPDALIDPNLPALGTWRQQLYKYGVDVNDQTVGANGLSVGENNFAKMHFDVVGQAEGFDAAEDYLNPSKIRKYVYETILPRLDDAAIEQGTIFGQFITPAEFAEDALEGVDPNIPESWEQVLKEMEDRGEIENAENWSGTYEDLKEMIMEVMRTGSAQQIRENIKYLNEKRKRPTQKELGVLYIERESDYKPKKLEGKTALYKTFQNAGFQGNEEDFYEDFFPDLNIEDQKLLTAAGENEGISGFMDMDFNDPFASFSKISEFMKDDEDDNEEEEKNKKEGSSYFDLSVDDDNDWDYKKKKTKSTFGNLSKLFTKD